MAHETNLTIRKRMKDCLQMYRDPGQIPASLAQLFSAVSRTPCSFTAPDPAEIHKLHLLAFPPPLNIRQTSLKAQHLLAIVRKQTTIRRPQHEKALVMGHAGIVYSTQPTISQAERWKKKKKKNLPAPTWQACCHRSGRERSPTKQTQVDCIRNTIYFSSCMGSNQWQCYKWKAPITYQNQADHLCGWTVHTHSAKLCSPCFASPSRYFSNTTRRPNNVIHIGKEIILIFITGKGIWQLEFLSKKKKKKWT